jgi:membrane-associated protein
MNPTDLLLSMASSPWSLVLLAILLIIDGFFPFVPGETAVVALATLSAAGNGPPVWLVLLVAIVASTIGDSIAYLNGRRIGLSRWAWMRHRRVAPMFEWARKGLARRPAVFLMSAKFVPVARVAVTMTAGASKLPFARYLPIATLASTVYTGYHVVVSVFAASLLSTNPLLAALAAIGTVIALGLAREVVDRALARKVLSRAPGSRPLCSRGLRKNSPT